MRKKMAEHDSRDYWMRTIIKLPLQESWESINPGSKSEAMAGWTRFTRIHDGLDRSRKHFLLNPVNLSIP
jgi:hypothetical protein